MSLGSIKYQWHLFIQYVLIENQHTNFSGKIPPAHTTWMKNREGWPQVGYLPFLFFSFLICKMVLLIVIITEELWILN